MGLKTIKTPFLQRTCRFPDETLNFRKDTLRGIRPFVLPEQPPLGVSPDGAESVGPLPVLAVRFPDTFILIVSLALGFRQAHSSLVNTG